MKKYFKIITAAVLALVCTCTSALAFTMYAPDGRTIEVAESDVALWQAVGWYTCPVVAIYAPDGREAYVSAEEKQLYLDWGWYDVPVCYIYAPDGRSAIIKKSETEAYVEVGWYTEPVMAVYALDGRIKVIKTSEKDEYAKQGWYDGPVTFMCNSKGEAVLAYRSAIGAFEEKGWWELPTLYSDKIREYSKALAMDKETFDAKYPDSSSINRLMLSKLIEEGGKGKIEYTLFDVDGNGSHELVFLSGDKLIDIYSISGRNLIKLYENCNFGETYRLHILSEGILFCEGSNGATTKSYKVHKLNGVGSALIKVKFAYYDIIGKQTYMKGFDYISKSDYDKAVKQYLEMSMYKNFSRNPIFS